MANAVPFGGQGTARGMIFVVHDPLTYNERVGVS